MREKISTSSKALILFAFLYLLPIIACQTQCNQQYNQTNIPKECDSTTFICNFQSFSNSSIDFNSSLPNQTDIVCVTLPGYQIIINGGIETVSYSIVINALQIQIANYSLINIYSVILIASSSINISFTNISANLFWIQANQSSISSSIFKTETQFATDCNCINRANSCDIKEYYFPFLYSSVTNPSNFSMQLMNFTFNTWNFYGNDVKSIVILSNNTINLLNSQLRVSVIALYTPSLTIDNVTLNTTGLGFSSGTGYGCGYFNEVLNQLLGCSGTGGSYGGFGGNSSPEGCNLLFSNQPYGRDLIPKYPGSGGGFFLKQITQISSGGGIINIQTINLTLINSIIQSNGVGGIQGGGGGSGGSVSVDYTNIATINSSKIIADGGIGKSSGSGGRIRFWDQNWPTATASSPYLHLSISAFGGGLCQSELTCGLNGSIISSPCPPGYSTNFTTFSCFKCNTGSYQLLYGYGGCIKCGRIPNNAIYVNISSVSNNQLSMYSNVCKFNCDKNYYSYKDQECLSRFSYLLTSIGGANLLISIGLVIASIIIYLVITMIRKLSYSESNLSNDHDNIDYYKKKSYFKVEDIPYHQKRIYFEGQNTPKRPWKISDKVIQNVKQFYQHSEQKQLIILRLIKELNQTCKYHKGVSIALLILKFIYFPISLILAQFFRQKKAKQIRSAIASKTQGLQSDLGLKFHVDQLYTIGCLQIFNYSKETLDFYIRNYFPMYFKLQKLQIGGYSIDSTDPLLRAIYSQFQDRNQKKLQNYLIKLNQLLKSQDISLYKHLWKISELWPVLQCFLWQPPAQPQFAALYNGILGMENRFEINRNVDLFLVFCVENRPQSVVNPINLSNNDEIQSLQPKVNKNFYYSVDFPNIYFDEISCIRHKYNLRQAMIDLQDKRGIFWQIENNFSEKCLSWTLGTVNIACLLLNLSAFFLIVFLLVEQSAKDFMLALLVYFLVFPLCQFFMIFIQFNLIVSKKNKIMSYSIYFTIFTIIKTLALAIILLIMAAVNGFDDMILLSLFMILLSLFLLDIFSLVLQCMLNARIIKTR